MLILIMEKSNFICYWNEKNGKVVYFVFLMLIVKLDEDIFVLIG